MQGDNLIALHSKGGDSTQYYEQLLLWGPHWNHEKKLAVPYTLKKVVPCFERKITFARFVKKYLFDVLKKSSIIHILKKKTAVPLSSVIFINCLLLSANWWSSDWSTMWH